MDTDNRMQDRSAARTPPRMSDLERIYMPAMPPLDLFRAIGEWFARMNRRRRVRRLLRYDDRQLRDIGYERRDVLDALQLPPWKDAAKALSDVQRARSR